jgi:hypothetical protein
MFKLELLPRELKFSHPSDQIELIENREGGWDWIHTNVDGHGTRDVTGWRLQPGEIISMIDKSIEPGPMTDEVKAMLLQEAQQSDTGIPRGMSGMGDGPTALPPPAPGEGGGISESTHPWRRDDSIWGNDIAAQKLIKKAIHAAHSRPDLRPTILPILRMTVKKA